MKSVFLFIALTAFMYSLFSFFYLSIDPHDWKEGGRFLFCFTEFMIFIGVIGYETTKRIK